MKKLSYFLILLIAVTVLSCKKDAEVVIPNVDLTVEGADSLNGISIAQGEKLVLGVKVDNTADYTVVWSLNGKEVSRDAKYIYIADQLGHQTIGLSVFNTAGGKKEQMYGFNVHGKYKYGTIVLNEGNMSNENGKLTFISPKGVVIDSAYWKENNSFIGNVAQDLFIADNKIYIMSQNGEANGGDGFLVIANAETLKKETAFKKDDLKTIVNEKEVSLSWPTHIAVVGANAYLRDNNGIYVLNITTRKMSYVANSKGAAKNRMAVVGDKVFVPAGKNIFVIKGSEIVHTIVMPGTVSGVIKSSDNNLWVSCTTRPAQINKIKSSDYSIIKTNELGEASVGAGWGASPAISAKGDTIYFSNASSKIHRHIFETNTTQFMTDVKEHIQDAGVVYSGLGVHPVTGQVYFNTIKGYGMDYLTNDISVFDFSGSTPRLVQDYKDYTSFPAGVFFTYNF